MIHVTDGISRQGFLASQGFHLLTGEACGLGMRVLCDVTEPAVRLLSEVLGCEVIPAGKWNNEPGAVGSVMIPSELFTPLVIFGMFQDPQVQMVYVTSDGIYGLTSNEELEQLDHASWVTIKRRIRRRGTAPGGLRHVHVFSGRVI